MRIYNQKGLGLLEVLIAVALLGGLALASMTLFKNQATAQKTVEKKYEVTVNALQIRTVLAVPANCNASLAGQNTNGGSVTKLKKLIEGAFEDVFVVNALQPGGIKVKDYRISKAFPNLASNEAILSVTFEQGKGTTLRDDTIRNIKLIVTEDASNTIQTCYATSTGTEIWTYGVDGTSIFYNGGNVAVGHALPVSALDVAGEIKVANSGVACSASNEGAIRYDSTIKNMRFCNGTDWKIFGEGSGQITPTGYWIFPGGLTFQWGTDNVRGDNSRHNFATAFNNWCFVTIVTTWRRGNRGANGHNHVLGCDRNGFTASIELGPGSAGAGWIAIGF